MGKGTPISQELRENIADDLALGYSFADIADRYGVSYSTIRRVKNNSPEAVPTLIEPASEDKKVDTIDTSIIPDVPEKVKSEPDCGGQQRTEMDNGGQYSPYEYAVDEAVLERMEKLRDRIAELQLDISNYENELNVLEEFHLKYMEAQSNGT